jgi:membrane protein implicated in regulation of membrane protease activity
MVYSFVAPRGLAGGFRAIWTATPQWLVFGFLVLNALFIFGEVSFLIVASAMNTPIEWTMHVPLVSLLLCSSAFVLLHARRHSYPGSSPAMHGRWTA